MELILNKNLPHQSKAVDAIGKCFQDVKIDKPKFSFQNPLIDIKDKKIEENINELQKSFPSLYKSKINDLDYLNIDVKMETGTGKTYVYTQTMYDLHENYGFNKFIILVPTLAIKAGAESFLSSQFVKNHFKNIHGYNGDIELLVLDSKKSKRNKNYFPNVVREFVNGSFQAKNKIYVLLSNMQHFQDKKQGMLTRDDYDTSVEGFFKPAEALSATSPIVLIDEPHRFSRDQKTFKFIEKQIKPQCIIRFGATFPTREVKVEKFKKVEKDYCNLVYNLGPAEAFNQNLVKGIAKEHIEPINDRNDKLKIVSIDSKRSVNIKYLKENSKPKTLTLIKGDNLSIFNEDIGELNIENIGKDFIEMSNGQIKYTGEEFNTDIYSSSYQEKMLRVALDRHFETERINFERKYKIKTLALFFIDDIYSYRTDKDSLKVPYLKLTFDRLLEEKIQSLLLDDTLSEEYRKYLLASKNDIKKTQGGYFAQDNSSNEEEIANEVREILKQKEKLLSIYNEDGSYNTRRFLFSKWTLKEGWDNPNIFTITKLRSSGSENSKLQEVGRGLRLPVDTQGNRISDEEFYLNYIVDFTEEKFATDLINEINGEIPEQIKIPEEILERIASRLNLSVDDIFEELLINRFIDRKYTIRDEKKDELLEKYPECSSLYKTTFNKRKVKDNNKSKNSQIVIRKDKFLQVRNLWDALNSTYHVIYKDIDNKIVTTQIKILLKASLTSKKSITTKREKIVVDETNRFRTEEDTSLFIENDIAIPYNDFLTKINGKTNLPIKQLHQVLIDLSKEIKLDGFKFTKEMALDFSKNFNQWKYNLIDEHIEYRKSKYSRTSTALTDSEGNVKEWISQGRLGVQILDSNPGEKYLYEKVAYDSPLEKDNILSEIENTLVFGKIPRSSIRIPMIDGGTYSPDFMYIVKSPNNDEEKVVIETKDVLSSEDIRGIEKIKIKSAKKFFESLQANGEKIYYKTQFKDQKINDIIDDIISKKN